MKKSRLSLLNLSVLFVSIFLTSSSLFAQGRVGMTILETDGVSLSGVSTLFAIDPLAQSLCFQDGGYGHVFQDNLVWNRCSEINYNSYQAGGFSVGIEGRREGVIIDLGTRADLSKRYGYEETVGAGQGFASITKADGKIYILQNRREQNTQALSESSALFNKPDSSLNSVPVVLGHIYILRITDGIDQNFERIVKLIVIAHSPNESVTFRWQELK